LEIPVNCITFSRIFAEINAVNAIPSDSNVLTDVVNHDTKHTEMEINKLPQYTVNFIIE
jgi:hypothetical protein